MDKVVQPATGDLCCTQMQHGKMACHQKQAQKQHDCEKQGCSMMFLCSICGFVVVQPLTIKPGFASVIAKPVPLYKIGYLSAYHPPNWKPPKAC